MTPEENPDTEPFILPHQRTAYDRLSALARACLYTNLSDLPIRIRPAVFLTGPSGSGKTHIARTLAKSMGLEIYAVSLSEWTLLGNSNRGALNTWPAICQFLSRSARSDGCIIFTDELDKIRTGGEYSRFLLTELYTLLDFRVPRNLRDEDGDPIRDTTIQNAEKVLREKTLIIGAGAFQEIWTATAPQIGFGTNAVQLPMSPDINMLAKYVPRELISRFGSRLVVLQPLVEKDYHDILGTILPRLPPHWRSKFEQLALCRIPEAARQQQGTRFFEELLLDVVVTERMEISAPLVAASVKPSDHETSPDLGNF
jgi:SpoVK/Ycf46/Vps4 family AAA+-type ATPase